MTRDPAKFGWHCWSNTAHPPPSSTTYVASQMPSPLLPLPQGCLYKATPWQQQMPISSLFRQNTYLQNKKHTLTCQVGLVVTDLITSPVVSWEGWETPPPPPQHRGSAVILCSTTGVVRPLCSCGDLLLSSARHCLRLVDVDWNTFSLWMSIFLSCFFFICELCQRN